MIFRRILKYYSKLFNILINILNYYKIYFKISKKFKRISEENTNYAWGIKLTKILIEIIPLSSGEKDEIFNEIRMNLVDENSLLLTQLIYLKFGIDGFLKIIFFLASKNQLYFC